MESIRSAYDAQQAPVAEAIHITKAPSAAAPVATKVRKIQEAVPDEGESGTSQAVQVPGERGPVSVVLARPIKKKRVVDEDSDDEAVLASQKPRAFSSSGMQLDGAWTAASASAPLTVPLPAYQYTQTNTLAIALNANLKSNGWALNICLGSDKYLTDVLLHFNPRYLAGALLMTDRTGTWGEPIKKRLLTTDSLFAQHTELVIQFRPEGFLVFANDRFATFFPHRRPLPAAETDMKVVFITADDNGKEMEVTVNKVWWGHLDLEREILSPSVRTYMEKAVAELPATLANPMLPRTLLVSNLPLLDDLEELQGLEYALFDLFEGFSAEAICMVRGAGLAYCRLPSQEAALAAMHELQGSIMQVPDGECAVGLRTVSAEQDIAEQEAAAVRDSDGAGTAEGQEMHEQEQQDEDEEAMDEVAEQEFEHVEEDEEGEVEADEGDEEEDETFL